MPLTIDDFEGSVFDHLEGYFAGAGPIPDPVSPFTPVVVSGNSGFTPGADPFVELDLLWSSRSHIGGDDRPVFEGRGVLQATLYVPIGWGSKALARMADRVQDAWRAMSVAGIKTYGTVPPRPAPQPPSGFVGRIVDTPVLWLSAPSDEVYVSITGIEYIQAGHGLTLGQAVVDSGDEWITAQANGTNPQDASGLATGLVVLVRDANRIRIVAEPAVLSFDHGFAIGDVLWLSQATAGLITTTKPDDGWRQQLGRILPRSLLLWEPTIPEFA